MSEALYFVAALPHETVSEEIWNFKREVAEQSGSIRGLKVMPHITFISPFQYEEEKEEVMTAALRKLVMPFVPETVYLKNFGYFSNPKSYTIYVAVEKTAIMAEEYKSLNIYTREKLIAGHEWPLHSFTPHMTIAYRDLTPERFEKAWPLFRDRKYEATMQLDRLWLLKHNGKHWEPKQELVFQGSKRELF